MGKRTVVAGRGMPGKDDENYTLYDDGCMLIRGVRGSYVHAGKAYQGKEQKAKGLPGKYGIVCLLPKGTHDKAKRLVEREIQKMLDEKNKGKPLDDTNVFLRDGDLKKSKPEYAGHWTVNAGENDPPILRGINGEKIDREHLGERKIDEMFQSGFWYDVLIQPWWQDNDWGTKVNCNIRAVKLDKKDETFGDGGAITDDDVDEVFGTKGNTGGFEDDDEL